MLAFDILDGERNDPSLTLPVRAIETFCSERHLDMAFLATLRGFDRIVCGHRRGDYASGEPDHIGTDQAANIPEGATIRDFDPSEDAPWL